MREHTAWSLDLASFESAWEVTASKHRYVIRLSVSAHFSPKTPRGPAVVFSVNIRSTRSRNRLSRDQLRETDLLKEVVSALGPKYSESSSYPDWDRTRSIDLTHVMRRRTDPAGVLREFGRLLEAVSGGSDRTAVKSSRRAAKPNRGEELFAICTALVSQSRRWRISSLGYWVRPEAVSNGGRWSIHASLAPMVASARSSPGIGSVLSVWHKGGLRVWPWFQSTKRDLLKRGFRKHGGDERHSKSAAFIRFYPTLSRRVLAAEANYLERCITEATLQPRRVQSGA